MGRGACTTYAGDMANADWIMIEGSNMAECHPIAFRWVMQAKLKGAKVIHVDPRFTRTSAMADIYAPIRAGTDIAFLGGLINYVIQNDKYFKEYVVTYTNAATILRDDFKDTEDMDGVFSGLRQTPNDPDAFIGQYDGATWQYNRTAVGESGRAGNIAQSGASPGTPSGQAGANAQAGVSGQPASPPSGPPYDDLVKSLLPPPAQRDETLQNPRTVFQVLKRHYSRYTPEMVERVTGMPRDVFLKVAQTITDNSGPERTGVISYAVGWTQHTYGPQMISTAALLQLLLGNIGRPGGGIMALRGHATIQGSTDIPTLYHSIHGYMTAPTVLKKHETLQEYLTVETVPGAYWANQPKFMVSYLKSMYGDAATKANDFGYGWHPRVTGDLSHMPMMVRMADGKVKGMMAMGQNPAVGGQDARMQRKAMAKLDWLVVKDNFLTETAAFWYNSPEIKNGELKTEDIKTEIFFFPSAQVAEGEGSFTNTQRLVQWHERALDPPGDARTDIWWTVQLGNRLKQMYANSNDPKDAGMKNMLWDFMPDKPLENTNIEGEPDALKVLREINGYDNAGKLLPSFANLKDDGSTTAASWIYTGIYPAAGQNRAASRKPDPDFKPGTHLNWGFAWPANRRIMYNRASAKPDGTPWSERKKYVYWDADKKTWTGPDIPDFSATKPPDDKPKPGGIGFDAQAGTDPFIMKADGKGWLFAPAGLVDGPLPTHYEPAESPVHNALYPQQDNSPVFKYWKRDDNQLAGVANDKYPHVLTTYRLTEHHLSGVMSRWLPWLAELQPELFTEISPELAKQIGVNNTDPVKISTPRGSIVAKALVTARMRPMQIDGKTVHHVGLPWHFGYQGVVTGAVVNDLSALVGDPNVSIHEGKAFVCAVEKA
jgi:formate dehydrogenase major subunit